MEVPPTFDDYIPRFVTSEQLDVLITYFNLARTALAGQSPSRHDRMLWAAREFHKENPSITETAAYKDLSARLSIGTF